MVATIGHSWGCSATERRIKLWWIAAVLRLLKSWSLTLVYHRALLRYLWQVDVELLIIADSLLLLLRRCNHALWSIGWGSLLLVRLLLLILWLLWLFKDLLGGECICGNSDRGSTTLALSRVDASWSHIWGDYLCSLGGSVVVCWIRLSNLELVILLLQWLWLLRAWYCLSWCHHAWSRRTRLGQLGQLLSLIKH